MGNLRDAARAWVASEVDAYPGVTMDDRIASWMHGGVHPDDVSRFLVDAYEEGHRAALAAEDRREAPDAGAAGMREACEKAAHAAAVFVDETWREGADATAWHPIKAMLIRDAVRSATSALPLPSATGDATRVPAPDAVEKARDFAGYEVERARFDAWWGGKSDGYKRAPGKGADLSGVAWDAYYARALLAALAAAPTDAGAAGMPVRWCVTRADGTFNGTEETEAEAARRVDLLNRSVDALVRYRGPYRVTPLYALPLPAPDAVETARREFYEAAMDAIGCRAAYGPDHKDAMNPSRKVHEAWKALLAAEAERARGGKGA